jgi:hypothetical protein
MITDVFIGVHTPDDFPSATHLSGAAEEGRQPHCLANRGLKLRELRPQTTIGGTLAKELSFEQDSRICMFLFR